MLTVFRAHPDVLAEYHGRITHIMVDEYQDTNVAQYLWLRLLTGLTATCAASGMTTSRFMAGVAPKSVIS